MPLESSAGVALSSAVRTVTDVGALGVDHALTCPTAVAPAMESARAVADCLQGRSYGLPVLSCWIGDETARRARRMLPMAASGLIAALSSAVTPPMRSDCWLIQPSVCKR